VTPHLLAGEDGSSTLTANSRRYESVVKDHSVGGQLVKIGRLNNLVAHAAQIVVPLIIGE